MINIKEGMYVRASVDYEDRNNPRMFAMGQVKEIKDEKVLLDFHRNFWHKDEDSISDYVPKREWYDIEDVSRCKILKGTKVFNFFEIAQTLTYSGQDEEGFYEYYIKYNDGKVAKVREDEIMADFNRVQANPLEQMMAYEFHNPFWYEKRRIAAEAINVLENFGDGIKTLIGSRTFLFEHQIDTIIRALNEKKCRLMLADEVGLGKTIEALVIIKGLKKKNERILLIIPEALTNQWRNELEFKFWMKSVIFDGTNIDDGDIVIVSSEDINLLNMKDIKGEFDYCVIDEVHRLVGEEKVYNEILQISKSVSKLLLLSATPIQKRKEEYLKLLTLLKPDKYEDLSEEEFSDIVDKNKKIKKLVYKICRDLPEIYGEEIDEDDVEEIFDYLEEISDDLEDKCLEKMVDDLDLDSEDCGEEKVREILAYISMNYQFEKNIIRHRREELRDVLPKRELETIYYTMNSSAENYYESNCYESLLSYIERLKECCEWNVELQEYIRILLNATFSSPWALENLIKIRKNSLKNGIISFYNSSIVSSFRKEKLRNKTIIESIERVQDEEEYLEELEYLLSNWIKAADKEILNIEECMNDPDIIKGRLIKIADYIEQELYDEKLVIFTAWAETLEKFKSILTSLYGEDSVSTFYVGNNTEELEENVYRFQNSPECRFMLCDELGGEGRNFQMADAIVHIDISFSPTILEQRIGRLDRIGRDKEKPVRNIVVVSEDTVEQSLFDLWKDGLNIFNESLSGMEIALDDIDREILEAFKYDIKYGLNDAITEIKRNADEMRKEIEEERYYDMARQLDLNTKGKYETIIDQFDNKGGALLAKMMLDWCTAIGFMPSYSEEGILEFDRGSVKGISMEHTLFQIPDTSISLERSNKKNVIRGTFDRSMAVNKEDLVFFAPGEEIFESIMKNVEEGFRGKSTATEIKNAPFNWEGFIFSYNVNFRVKELLDNGFDIKNVNYSYGYIPSKQYRNFISIDESVIDESVIRAFVDEFFGSNKTVCKSMKHIGERRGFNSNIKQFKEKYRINEWKSIIKNSSKKSIEEVRKKYKRDIDIREIKRNFSSIYAGARASQLYFNSEENSGYLKSVLECVMRGIAIPEISLDSIMYLKLEK